MANSRSFVDNDQITDLSSGFTNIPNRWGMISALGLFETELKTQKTVTFDEVTQSTVLLEDSPYEERQEYGKQEDRKTHALAIPHFSYADKLRKSEIAGFRADGSNEEESIASARAKVLTRAMRNYEATLEYSRAYLLTTGNVYAPNGTVSHNIFSEFGVTQKSVNYAFAGTPNLIEKAEEVISHIQDNLNSGQMVGRIMVLCSPEFFASMLKDAGVQDAYNMYQNTNQFGGRQVLRDRLENPTDVRSRVFLHGGLEYVEYRGSFKNKAGTEQRFIPANEAVAFPVDVDDMYKTFYAPADIFGVESTQTLYTFEEQGRRVWEYESESNFMNWIDRPAAIVKLTSA